MNLRKSAAQTVAATTIGVLALSVGGLGIATAANGGSLVLGGHNSATKTTVLKDKKGTPLSLIGKLGKAPLKVNSDGLVKHLNAAELGGLSAGQLSVVSQTTLPFAITALFGSGGSLPGIPLLFPTHSGSTITGLNPIAVFTSHKLDAGKYLAIGAFQGNPAVCWVGTTPNAASPAYSLTEEFLLTAYSSGVFKVNKGQTIKGYCAGIDTTTTDPAGGYIVGGALTVLRVQKSVAGSHLPATANAGAVRKASH